MAWDVIIMGRKPPRQLSPVNRRGKQQLVVDAANVHDTKECWNGDEVLRRSNDMRSAELLQG